MASATPDLRSPSQPQSVATLWLGEQRHVCEQLAKGCYQLAAWQCTGRVSIQTSNLGVTSSARYRYITNTPFTRSSWFDELARQAGYMLAGRASSMFAQSCKRSISHGKYLFFRADTRSSKIRHGRDTCRRWSRVSRRSHRCWSHSSVQSSRWHRRTDILRAGCDTSHRSYTDSAWNTRPRPPYSNGLHQTGVVENFVAPENYSHTQQYGLGLRLRTGLNLGHRCKKTFQEK